MITLSQLLDQFGVAGQSAQIACTTAWREHVEGLCDDKDGVLHPKCVKVDVGDGNPVDVPLLALFGLHHMHLGKVSIEFESDVQLADAVDKTVKKHNPLRMTMTRGIGDSATTVKVSAEFAAHEPHEAMQQIRDRLVRRLTAALKETE